MHSDGQSVSRSDKQLRKEPLEFEELVALYDRKIYNLALRLLRDRDEAADASQETFVRAYKAWDGFEGRSSPYTWLCQIAINICRNRARDRSRWADELPDDDSLSAPEPRPEEVLQKAELADRVRQAIDDLPGNYRIIAVLRDLQGLTYQEIADVCGVSVDLVKTRLARARGMLRRKLEPYI